jgi:hypothetical protein
MQPRPCREAFGHSAGRVELVSDFASFHRLGLTGEVPTAEGLSSVETRVAL